MSRKIFYLVLILTWLFVTAPAGAYLPSDPMYYQQDYLRQINVAGAWDLAKGEGTVVAVLDSGVDIDHPDLKMNIWKNEQEIPDDNLDNDHNGLIDDVVGWDFVDNVADPNPKLIAGFSVAGINHGTAIAGLIAAVANNGEGITGVAFGAKIMPLRVLGSDGVGEVTDLVKAIEYAVGQGADIINLSLVGYEYSEELFETIKWASQQGVLVVAAAGNSNDSVEGVNLDVVSAYPACYDDNANNNFILAVSSVGLQNQKSYFASFGRCVDLMAPGEDLTSLAFYQPADSFNDYYSYHCDGTSLATALISGVVALVKSQNRSLGPQELINVLMAQAQDIDAFNPLYRGRLGSGVVDAWQAVKAAAVDYRGRLIKLQNDPAVYYLDSTNKRYNFSTSATFWSWYSGSWATQKMEIVSKEKFDSLKVGSNLTVRPGNLLRFGNSGKIYTVSTGGILHQVSTKLAAKLFGSNYSGLIVKVPLIWGNNYQIGEPLVDKYPDGFLIQYQGSTDLWYLQNGLKRLISPEAFLANGFKEKNIIKNVISSIDYPAGRPLKNWESNIFPYLK